MTDRPILFSAPMVRALYEERKTMTRHSIAPQNFKLLGHDFRFHRPDAESLASAFKGARDFRWIGGAFSWIADPGKMHPHAVSVDCRGRPKYAPGDRLWVRETCATWGRGPERAPVEYPVAYAADDPEWEGIKHDAKVSSGDEWKIRPSIHMPRWASRLTLIVTDVRVEWLQDISEEDAIAEGVECDSDGWRDYLMPQTQCCAAARDSFRSLWDSINGAGAWDENPWVTVTSFAVHRQNIDQMEAA